MVPHVDVHGGGNDYGRGSCQKESGEKIVGNSLGKFCEDVGGGGSDDQRVNGLRYRYMFDGGVNVGFGSGVCGKDAGDDLFSGEGGR